MRIRLKTDIDVERLGGEFLLYDPSENMVHRVEVTGAWLDDLMAGHIVEVDTASVSRLVAAGVVETVPDDAPATASRRRVLAVASAATAAVGLTTLVLPSAAAAASPSPSTPTAPPTTVFDPPPTTPELFVGQGSNGSIPNNRVIITYTQAGVDIDFDYVITGPITATVSGSASGFVLRTVAGWEIGETITIKVTGTNPVLAQETRTLVF